MKLDDPGNSEGDARGQHGAASNAEAVAPSRQSGVLEVLCAFSWEKLVDMKENNVEFWTADGSKRLRIVEVNRKAKSLYMICCQTGKITWPLKFQ
jgi:hypothetical protein